MGCSTARRPGLVGEQHRHAVVDAVGPPALLVRALQLRVGRADGVAQLAVGEAAFWVATEDAALGRFQPAGRDGATCRFLLVVDDPASVVAAALTAGATELSPVADEHAWRLGRVVDPFGHEWELGHPLGDWPRR